MQTFLTSAKGLTIEGYAQSAKNLDNKRLASQVKENYQIFRAITDNPRFTEEQLCASIVARENLPPQITPTILLNAEEEMKLKSQKGWKNHPAVVMWRNNVEHHFAYSHEIARELYKRGHNSHAFLSHYLLYTQNPQATTLADAIDQPTQPTTLPVTWEDQYQEVLNTHRGNLYMKDNLTYGRWREYRIYPPKYPTKTSNRGYYWPKETI
jgi:hypothetical protein